ncbi:restriction endonuclease subunit S [Lactobacillus mulieris]|uniref:restriction endonuclease subunit S n=4 Tax=Lactobacillus mulieris TaxID=2508708 RepID=UPI0009C0E18B|nr:restriction endonuclease subunit S [Lactobacillus mulieris]
MTDDLMKSSGSRDAGNSTHADEQRLYPKVRFRGFDEPWKKVKLEEISERVNGNDNRFNLPVLTISAKTGWMTQEDRFSGDISGKQKKNYTLLHKGELSYNHGNSKVAKYGAVFSLQNYSEALIPHVYHSFKIIKETTPVFIENFFKKKDVNKQLRKYISSSARMDGLLNISYSDFMKVHLFISQKISETKQIDKIFEILNSLLSLQQRKLELEKQLKKFCLQNILSDNKKCPNLRFHDFSTNWKKVKVGDIFTVTRGKVLSKDKISKTKDHIMKYPVYSSQTLNNGLLGYYHDYLFEDAITWTTDGANAGTVRLRAGKFYGTNVNGVLLSKNGYVNDANAEALNQIAWKYVSKVGNPKLMNNVMQNIMFSIAPSVEEQVIISKLFILHSKSLKIYQANINVYTQLKQFLLQNLFI